MAAFHRTLMLECMLADGPRCEKSQLIVEVETTSSVKSNINKSIM